MYNTCMIIYFFRIMENQCKFYKLANTVKYYSKFIKEKHVIFNQTILNIFLRMYASIIKEKTDKSIISVKLVYDIMQNEPVRLMIIDKIEYHVVFIPFIVKTLYNLHTFNITPINSNNYNCDLFSDDVVILNKKDLDSSYFEEPITTVSFIEKKLICLYVLADHAAAHYISGKYNSHDKFKSLAKFLSVNESEENDEDLFLSESSKEYYNKD